MKHDLYFDNIVLSILIDLGIDLGCHVQSLHTFPNSVSAISWSSDISTDHTQTNKSSLFSIARIQHY